jgi:hypothetical protein
MRTIARTLLAAGLAVCLPLPAPGGRPPASRATVYLARGLSDEALVVLGAALAGREDILLLDSEGLSGPLRSFLKDYHPGRLVAVGDFPGGAAALERRLGVRPEAVRPWSAATARRLWRALLPAGDSVVVCPPAPRPLLLQAACLAGTVGAPLLVVRGGADGAAALQRLADERRPGWVYFVGDAGRLASGWTGPHARLSGEEAVAAAHRAALARGGPVETAVVANPADSARGDLSPLAPWLAVQKHAALLLTGPGGANVEEVVGRAAAQDTLRHLDTLILLAGLEAVPWRRRPNPVPGKDAEIEMEPLTPSGYAPFSYAVGRLFHEDRAVVPLTLARQRLLAGLPGPRRALVVSNPGGGLSLLETFSRGTAAQLSNAGYRTTARFGNDVHPDELRRLLPQNQVFLWEGHHNTLINEWGFPSWDEPLPPQLVFLQSCLALAEAKVGPLQRRGAVAVLGTSTRTYSASGGACSMAFFDALLYDGRPLGASLRQAKNYLLACTLLKEKRLGSEAARKGAGMRAAWAFTLWGDPTLQLPPPPPAAAARPPVRHEVTGNTLVLQLPDVRPEAVRSDRYDAELLPNARLAGLVRKEAGGDEDRREVVPLVFAEVSLPRAPRGRLPRLSSKLPSARWVFCWDERRRTGYLLAAPRPEDTHELRFRVRWEPAETAAAGKP